MSAPVAPPRQFESVRAMRGVAALAVAISHVPSFVPASIAAPDMTSWAVGKAGVDVFFVISGFVMATATAGLVPGWQTSLQFLWRRLARVAPLYWIVTLFLAAAFTLNKNFGADRVLDANLLLKSLLFFPVHSPEGGIRPIIGVGWSLDYEMYFYLCVAVALSLFARHRLALIALGMSLLCVATALWLDPRVDWVVNSGLALEFLLGFVVATNLRHAGRVWAWLALVVVACFFMRSTLQSLHPYGAGLDRTLSWGLLAFALILTVTALEHRRTTSRPVPLLGRLGDASYALYLTHSLGFAVIQRAVLRFSPEVNFGLYLVLLLTTAMVVALAIHRWIERPLTDWLQARSPPGGRTVKGD